MLFTKGFAAQSPTSPLEPFSFQRRELKPKDVLIEIMYCGICHSDVHQARNEWGASIFPIVPGHEIVGKITKIGSSVKRFHIGETVGVGCLVDSCRACSCCHEGLEQFCSAAVWTYNSTTKDSETPTYGGYSSQIVVDEDYVLHISENLALDRVAPLLCAGITTYSPLKYCKVGKGQQVAVAGLGGLGHMAVKLASAMGAEVTVLSTSAAKAKDAQKLGAHHFAVTADKGTFTTLAGHFDLIINTIAVPHDIDAYLRLLKVEGTMVMVGLPSTSFNLHPSSLIQGRKKLMGSLIGGIAETQEMLDYCAEHNILSDIEVIPIQEINTAYERMLKGDVRYRFVVDMKSLVD
ncbi:MAG: alcohol dehydrogenase [Gammaproteobacteria bacterium]|jgi:uncharacterized zinc-type alcohol dehydrogenase-like protein|nr:alcohol dehydrogenase [Gammaproteobacteria bacterium]